MTVPAAKKLDRALGRVEDVLAIGAGIGTVVLMVIFAFDVVGRYILISPIAIKYELTELLLMSALVSLSVSWVYRQRGHVALTMLYDALPWTARVGLTTVHSLLILGFSVLLTAFSFLKTYDAYVRDLILVGEINWVLWLCWSVVPIGFAVLCLRVLIDLLKLCTGGATEVVPLQPRHEELH